MTIYNNRLLQDDEDMKAKDGLVSQPEKLPDSFDDWVAKHPQGITLPTSGGGGVLPEGVEPTLEIARAAKAHVTGSKPEIKTPKDIELGSIGRPSMPEGGPRPFTDFSRYQPQKGDDAPEVVSTQSKFLGDRSSPGGVDRELLDAQRFAGQQRMTAGLFEAGRMLGHAGLAPEQGGEKRDAQAMAAADQPIQALTAQRNSMRQRTADARADEDQGFQRNTDRRAEQQSGFNAEKNTRDRDYNDPASDLSKRRRAELIGLYGKQVSKVPYEDLSQLSGADVDVLMKELQQERASKASDRSAAAMERAFAAQVAKVGDNSAKLPYGELEGLASDLESKAPGITTGTYKGEDPVGGKLNRFLLSAPGGIGEHFVDDKALSTSKDLKELTDLVERMRSGAVINDSEARHYTGLLGYGAGQDSRSLSQGVSTVLNSIRSKLRNQQAGYNYMRNDKGQTPLDVFSSNGGTDYRKAPMVGTGHGGRVQMIGPNGEIGTIDASEVDEAQSNGWKRR